jgi:hypothetical protein
VIGMVSIRKGDILVCKKDCYCNSNYNLKGNRYIVKNVIVDGNMNVNVYVSTDYIGGVGVSTPFSLYKDYDKYKSHSSYHLYDYFVSLVEVREQKLQQLGL